MEIVIALGLILLVLAFLVGRRIDTANRERRTLKALGKWLPVLLLCVVFLTPAAFGQEPGDTAPPPPHDEGVGISVVVMIEGLWSRIWDAVRSFDLGAFLSFGRHP